MLNGEQNMRIAFIYIIENIYLYYEEDNMAMRMQVHF